MTIHYLVHEEKDGQATVEFIDSETQLFTTRTINIADLKEEDIASRIADHERTFAYRVSLGMIKPPEETSPGPESEPVEVLDPVDDPNFEEPPVRATKSTKKK